MDEQQEVGIGTPSSHDCFHFVLDRTVAAPFEISLPAISRHLKVLERAGLISRGRDAQRRPCQLRAAALDEITRWTQHTREAWSERFEQLDEYLKKLQTKPAKEKKSNGRKKS